MYVFALVVSVLATLSLVLSLSVSLSVSLSLSHALSPLSRVTFSLALESLTPEELLSSSLESQSDGLVPS